MLFLFAYLFFFWSQERGKNKQTLSREMQSISTSVELEGVVMKVRKASRTLAFLCIKVNKLVLGGNTSIAETREGDEFVQAVFEHAEGWRNVCGRDGRRICCGSVLSLFGEREGDDVPQEADQKAISVLVREGDLKNILIFI